MITSKSTSINKNKVPKLFTIIDKHYGWMKGTKNFDIGGGKFDTATKYLKQKGVKNLLIDKYNRTIGHNFRICLYLTTHEIHTVTLSNVLNVIKSKEEKLLLISVANASLKPGGIIYINVYEGDKSGKGRMTKKDCWQENKLLKYYLPLVKKVFGNGRIEHGIIIATKEE